MIPTINRRIRNQKFKSYLYKNKKKMNIDDIVVSSHHFSLVACRSKAVVGQDEK